MGDIRQENPSTDTDPRALGPRDLTSEAGTDLASDLLRLGPHRDFTVAKTILYPFTLCVLLLAIWEAVVRGGLVDAFLLPPPSSIVSEAWDSRNIIWANTRVTAVEVLVGFAASALIGTALAVLMTESQTVERAFYPLLVTAQVVPKIALAPLIIVWFGFGLMPKFIIVFLVSFFPVVIDTSAGLKSTRRDMLYLAETMGASGWQTFWKIRFPNALPFVFSGLKLAMVLAVIGAVVGEFVGASEGLGWLIQVAGGQLDTELLFAALAVLSGLGVLLFLCVDLTEYLVLGRSRPR